MGPYNSKDVYKGPDKLWSLAKQERNNALAVYDVLGPKI